jgi:osmotically-inducible protein OsmY
MAPAFFCPPTLNAAQRLSDQEISDAVEDKIKADGVVPANQIDVKSSVGVVTLSGTVDNLLVKERAVRLAETIRGVKAVINKIYVKSIKRDDAAIKKDIVKAFSRNPAIQASNLKTEVQNSIVVLSGEVQSWRERTLAMTLAKSVKGVNDVRDAIAIKSPKERSDEEIKNDIVQALKWDVLVERNNISVDVKGGRVKLTGTVGSAAEKSRAMTLASVTGMKEVDASGLEVEPSQDKEKMPSRGIITDEQIKKAVQNALLVDPRVTALKVMVDVTGQVVTLRGVVETLEAKRAAQQDALNTRGVTVVKNRLKVKPKLELDDSRIAEDVRDALTTDPFVDKYEVAVSVVGNVAYLSGTVDTAFEKAQAEFTASTVAGVVDVVNWLSVRNNTTYIYDPFVDDFIFYDFYNSAPERGILKYEMQLGQDIKNQMAWSPFVDANQVKVNVDGAVVTLTGTVTSRYEKEMAAKNAFDAGAPIVINQLKLRAK